MIWLFLHAPCGHSPSQFVHCLHLYPGILILQRYYLVVHSLIRSYLSLIQSQDGYNQGKDKFLILLFTWLEIISV